jgi:ketosteroid isomerase-like protein
MKTIWIAVLALSTLQLAAACPVGQATNGDALVQVEQTWAKALEKKDADTVGCILAEEFQDIEPDGEVRDRASSLEHIAHRRPGSNRLSELTPHVFGEVAYVRGLNTVVDAEGNTLAKVRFTDIFVYREGRWLAVAGQESLVSDAAK